MHLERIIFRLNCQQEPAYLMQVLLREKHAYKFIEPLQNVFLVGGGGGRGGGGERIQIY